MSASVGNETKTKSSSSLSSSSSSSSTSSSNVSSDKVLSSYNPNDFDYGGEYWWLMDGLEHRDSRWSFELRKESIIRCKDKTIDKCTEYCRQHSKKD